MRRIVDIYHCLGVNSHVHSGETVIWGDGMTATRSRWRVVVLVATLALFLPLVVAGPGVHRAGATTTACPFGTDVASAASLAVSLNGTTLSEVSTAPPVFQSGANLYEVNLCRNLDLTGQNNVYFFNVLPATEVSGSYVTNDFTSADVEDVFGITFTPISSDIPIEIEAHGKLSSYAVNGSVASQVTFNVAPVSFNDIHGCPIDATSVSGCCLGQSITVGGVTGPETPEQCAARVEDASDNAVQLWGSVRFQTASGQGSGQFQNLIGLQVSAASFVYYTHAQCPTSSGSASGNGLYVDLAGPHYEPDGTTLATGSLGVFIPASAIAQCFGTSPQYYVDNMLITRTELGSTTTLAPLTAPGTGEYYTVTADDTGVRFSFPTVTYSQPTYGLATKTGKALDRTTQTFAALEKKSGEKLPSKGKWRVTTKAGSKVCAAGTTKVFGFAKGTCSYTVAALTSTGRVSVSKNGSFVVK